MFSNIGGKIKTVSLCFCAIGAIISILAGIIMMVYGYSAYRGDSFVVIGIFIMILGPLVSWISSFLLYGYGQLIENSDILVAKEKPSNFKLQNLFENTNEKIETLNNWKEQGLITEKEYLQKVKNIK